MVISDLLIGNIAFSQISFSVFWEVNLILFVLFKGLGGDFKTGFCSIFP